MVKLCKFLNEDEKQRNELKPAISYRYEYGNKIENSVKVRLIKIPLISNIKITPTVDEMDEHVLSKFSALKRLIYSVICLFIELLN